MRYQDVLLLVNVFYIPCELLKLVYKILSKPAENKLGEAVVLKPLIVQTVTYVLIWGVMTGVAFVGHEPLVLQSENKYSNLFIMVLLQCLI